VSAYGVKLSGMNKEQAIAALASRYTYGENAVFTFRDGDRSWQRSARDLGVTFDPQQTVQAALKVGRDSDLVGNLTTQIDSWATGYAIQPTIIFDQSKAAGFLQKVATDINTPMRDATISLSGT